MRNVIYAGRDAVVKLPDGSLVQCSSEPIHSPSSVQGHGILLVLSPCLDIQMISTDNVLQYTGVSAASLLGSFLSDILDYDMPLDALQQSRQSQNKLTLKARLKKAHTPVVLSLHYSPCGKYILVDLELDDDTLYPRDVLLRSDCPSLALLTEQIATLPRDTLQNFLDGLTNTLRQATGFERAFTYQFDQDGHAVILSESVDPSKGLEIKYKGFIFPRSGIVYYIPCRTLY